MAKFANLLLIELSLKLRSLIKEKALSRLALLHNKKAWLVYGGNIMFFLASKRPLAIVK